MNSFEDFNFKTFYSRTDSDSDIAEDFFMPCMENAVRYDRITGFFGSSVYIVIWGALKRFVENGGRMRVLCSPRISEEDCQAINEGLESRENPAIIKALRDEIEIMFGSDELTLPSRLLSCLIATGIMEIRIVTTSYEDIPPSYQTMFHDKVGIFSDTFGNMVAFGGSMNETFQGLSSYGNSETVSVNISWDLGRDGKRTKDYARLFEEIWAKRAANVKVHDLPSEIKAVLEEYSRDFDFEDLLRQVEVRRSKIQIREYIVGNFHLQPHQCDAYDSWVLKNRHGILKHATGSGKTVTGLYCIEKSLERGEIPLVIVPSADLQRQWRGNIVNAIPSVRILECGGSDSTDWRKNLGPWSSDAKGRRIILAVVNTACSDSFLKNLNQGDHLFIIGDEVHRLGSPEFRKALSIVSGPRLGLSATPERFRDSEGTEAITRYFGPVVHTFTLEDAIAAGRLTEYFYHPMMIGLTAEETERWNDLTLRISKAIGMSEEKDPFDDERVKKLFISRARIAKNAENKIEAAAEIIHKYYESPQKWLVYCDNLEQLNALWRRIDNPRFNVMKYYSSMMGDRRSTIDFFNNYGGILLSIKCLDEGVDIPSVSHALIIASSQNPREHIQRRGRVLRLSPNKTYSHIYDLVIIPDRAMDAKFDSLIASELSRAIKFGEHAVNSGSCVSDLRMAAIGLGIDLEAAARDGYEGDEGSDD